MKEHLSRAAPWIALSAASALVLQHGFLIGLRFEFWFQLTDILLAVGCLLMTLLPLCGGDKSFRTLFQDQRSVECLVLIIFAIGLAIYAGLSPDSRSTLAIWFHQDSAEDVTLGWIQLFLLAHIGLQLARFIQRIFRRGTRPELVLAGSFASLIVLGTLLLLLPRATSNHSEPGTFLDAFFTATSAVCVTGLVVRDTGVDYSTFGQLIIMALFQLGGLGIVTFFAFISVFSSRNLPLPQLLVFRQTLNSSSLHELKRRLLGMVALTLAIEGAGTLFLYRSLSRIPDMTMDTFDKVYWSAFHSVSAFCNAGFALHGNSLEFARTEPGINLGIMVLIVLGGLGFLVIPELLGCLSERIKHLASRLGSHRYRFLQPIMTRLALQARLSLGITGILLVVGSLGFLLLEYGHTLHEDTLGDKLLISAFQSATTRTAGFNTIPIQELQQSTLLLVTALMIIGGCPLSTAGGIKTVTFAILLFTLRSLIFQRKQVEAFGRAIPQQALIAALSVFVLYTLSCGLGVFIMTCLDPEIALRDVCFEMVSALSTVGLSTGITADLHPGSKALLCVAMFIGRVGPISLVLSIFHNRQTIDYEYPEEDVVVG